MGKIKSDGLKPYSELNTAGYKQAGSCRAGFCRVRLMAWGVACTVVALACMVIFVLPAKAAPATLSSPDATVYEQPDEGGNAVGNLVEGSAFEYIGDVTAEDGSVWHQVTTGNGVTGYIRGDREMAIGEEEPAPEEQEQQEGQAAPEGEGAPEGELPGEEGQPDGPEEGDGEGPEDDAVMAGSHSVRNNRTKSYSLDTSGRVKEKEDVAAAIGEDAGAGQEKKGINGAKKLDKTLLVSVAVVLFCGMAVYFFWGKMKGLGQATGEQEPPKENRGRNHKRNEKKSVPRKRKPGERPQARKGKQKRRR